MLGEMVVKKSLDKKSINDLGSPLILSYGVYYDDKTVANLLEERNYLIDEVSKMSEELDNVYTELEGYDRLLDIRDSRVYIRKYNKEYSKRVINDYKASGRKDIPCAVYPDAEHVYRNYFYNRDVLIKLEDYIHMMEKIYLFSDDKRNIFNRIAKKDSKIRKEAYKKFFENN